MDFIIIAASDSFLLKRAGCCLSSVALNKSAEARFTLLSSSSNKCDTPKSLILTYPLESNLKSLKNEWCHGKFPYLESGVWLVADNTHRMF
jgi:hypothetical protein